MELSTTIAWGCDGSAKGKPKFQLHWLKETRGLFAINVSIQSGVTTVPHLEAGGLCVVFVVVVVFVAIVVVSLVHHGRCYTIPVVSCACQPVFFVFLNTVLLITLLAVTRRAMTLNHIIGQMTPR
jgi:hypothetical protein